MTSSPKHEEIDCIKVAYDACTKSGEKIQNMISQLRQMGKSGLTFHDPITKNEIVVLSGVNEVLLQLMQEASCVYATTGYDSATKSISLPTKLTLFGQSNFSDTSLWGGAQSRKVDHNEAGADAPYDKNKQTLRNKRTFNIGPVSDCSEAQHLSTEPVDKLSMQIITGLSELSGLKEKLVSCCVVNARIERYILDTCQKDASGEISKKEQNTTQSATKFSGIMQKLKMAKNGPKTVPQLNQPSMRSQLIENLLSMEGSNIAFVVPYREYVSKGNDDKEPSITWKVETSVILGTERKHRTVFDAPKLQVLWKKVASVRLWELKAPLNFQHGQQVDPETAELAKHDKYTSAWVDFACGHGILPQHYKDVQIMDSTGALARITVPGKGTRAPNYFEYSAMSRSSMMQGSVLLLTCVSNAKDGCYYNPTHVQVITPANYLYRLVNAESPPELKMPYDDLFGLMRKVMGVDKNRADNCIREAETDMNNDYGLSKPEEPDCEGPGSVHREPIDDRLPREDGEPAQKRVKQNIVDSDESDNE
jgi:hypothetical protein